MDFEEIIETQRLRLLRLVAGLVVLVGFLSLGPVSRGFSVWSCHFVGSILSRAEAAGRYLVIAQARMIVAREGVAIDRSAFEDALARVVPVDSAESSLSECRGRLMALRALLLNLPRYARHLLRQIARRTRSSDQPALRPAARCSVTLRDWRLAAARIERPPDRRFFASLGLFPPPDNRAGGAARRATL